MENLGTIFSILEKKKKIFYFTYRIKFYLFLYLPQIREDALSSRFPLFNPNQIIPHLIGAAYWKTPVQLTHLSFNSVQIEIYTFSSFEFGVTIPINTKTFLDPVINKIFALNSSITLKFRERER